MKKRLIIIIPIVVILIGISIFAIIKINSKSELSKGDVSTQSKVETANINTNTKNKDTAIKVNLSNKNKKVVEPVKQERKAEKNNINEENKNNTQTVETSNNVVDLKHQNTVNMTAKNNTNKKDGNNTSKVLNEVGYITNSSFLNPVCAKYNGFNMYYPGNGTKVNVLGEKNNYYEISNGNTGDVDKNDITFINNQNEIHPNDNVFMSKYFGTWVVGKQIGETIGENGNYKTYSGDKLIINNKLFSFRGKNIVDPVYYVFASQGYFGNSKYDNLSNIHFTKAGPLILKVCEKGTVLTNEQYNNMFPEGNIIINGSSLATYGGGVGNTTIDECNKI